jgi:hypothetical protein
MLLVPGVISKESPQALSVVSDAVPLRSCEGRLVAAGSIGQRNTLIFIEDGVWI